MKPEKKESCEACHDIIYNFRDRQPKTHTCSKSHEEIMALIEISIKSDFYNTLKYKGD